MPSSLLQVVNSLFKIVTTTGNKQCEHNLLTACEQTCNSLFADLLQLVRFYVCSKNLTTCQQDVHVRNRLVASLSTSCNNAVILSSCYKVVTHNLLTNC